MNKPAPKEPSMDEILSSIRQIIADDDAAGVPRRPTIQAAPPPMQAAPARQADSLDRDLSDMLDDIEPLALSSAQIVDNSDDVGGFSFDSILADTESAEDEAPMASAGAPQLVDPEDIGFSIEEADDGLPSFDPPPMRKIEPTPAPPQPQQQARPAAPQPEPELARPEPARPAPRPQPTMAEAAPMPDPTLSSDMADQLLEPATQAAVRSSITKLNGLGLGNAGATLESLMRDMLRPMLKEWLDENLPSVVERMVEKEIARISRGE
jgi:cell pole-organizing protein PopZ